MTVATVEDATNRLGRPATADEEIKLSALLEDAEAEIVRRIPDMVLRTTTDANFKQRVILVECSAALRAARLPYGIDLVTPETGTVEFNPATQVGFISILRREWKTLGVGTMSIAGLTPGIDQVEANFKDYDLRWEEPRWLR